MNTSLRQRWARMPWLIRLIFVISLLESFAAALGVASLLAGAEYEVRWPVLSPLVTVTGLLLLFGILAYGIGTERRYPRMLAIIAFTAQPFASGELSWRVVISSALCLLLALWFLHWNETVIDYSIILGDHVRERRSAAI